MSELTNPLFDEEKEFLERKKLEYERALRGDMENIKEKSATVGRVALVGAGLTGSIFLITKLFGKSKKRRKSAEPDDEEYDAGENPSDEGSAYYTAGNGQRYKAKEQPKSARESASVFEAEVDSQRPEPSDSKSAGRNSLSDGEAHGVSSRSQQFGKDAPKRNEAKQPAKPQYEQSKPEKAVSAPAFAASDDDPFQDLPYDDSRRLPDTHQDFPDVDEAAPQLAGKSGFSSGTRMVGAVLHSFLQSDTGKMLVAQTAAVALTLITKKVSEFFPAEKNADLAVSPGYEPVKEGFSPKTSEPAHPSDDSTAASPQPQNIQ